jgi:hypothetical protein
VLKVFCRVKSIAQHGAESKVPWLLIEAKVRMFWSPQKSSPLGFAVIDRQM